MRFLRVLLLSAPLLGLAVSCGSDDDTGGSSTSAGRGGIFGPGVQSVTVEVDYQRGAEPYDAFERPGLSGSPWTLTRSNLEALFERSTPRSIVVPQQLSDMQALDDVSGTDFDVDALLAIADRHRDVPSTAEARSFYVVFVDGYFADASGRRDTVLGVSIGDTGVVAMFKPVISATLSDRFVEQATLVHELGHALGLVNNGLAMVQDHHDEANGAHCTNRDCVMYWANEGAADLVQFVQRLATDQNAVLFAPECLADAYAASG